MFVISAIYTMCEIKAIKYVKIIALGNSSILHHLMVNNKYSDAWKKKFLSHLSGSLCSDW